MILGRVIADFEKGRVKPKQRSWQDLVSTKDKRCICWFVGPQLLFLRKHKDLKWDFLFPLTTQGITEYGTSFISYHCGYIWEKNIFPQFILYHLWLFIFN